MMRILKFFVIVSVVLLAEPVQASEHTISVDGFGMVKVTINIGDTNVVPIANKASASAVVKIVSEKTGLLEILVGLACAESRVPVMPGKVNVIKCAYMVS
jgi:hypothetical protein